MKMVKTLPEFEYILTVFLNNRNFFFQNENIKSYRLCSFKTAINQNTMKCKIVVLQRVKSNMQPNNMLQLTVGFDHIYLWVSI